MKVESCRLCATSGRSRGRIVRREDVADPEPGPPRPMIRQAHQRGYSCRPSLRRASCAGVRTILPSTIGGQTNLPLSSRLRTDISRCRRNRGSSGSRLFWIERGTDGPRTGRLAAHAPPGRTARQTRDACSPDRRPNRPWCRSHGSRSSLQDSQDTTKRALIDEGIHPQPNAVHQIDLDHPRPLIHPGRAMLARPESPDATASGRSPSISAGTPPCSRATMPIGMNSGELAGDGAASGRAIATDDVALAAQADAAPAALFQVKTRLAFRPCRRATSATEAPGRTASSTIRRFLPATINDGSPCLDLCSWSGSCSPKMRSTFAFHPQQARRPLLK